jgi:hypothetical protein
MSAHADSGASIVLAIADPRRPIDQVKLMRPASPPKSWLLPVANCSPNEIAGTRALSHDSSYANVSVISDVSVNFRFPRKLDAI